MKEFLNEISIWCINHTSSSQTIRDGRNPTKNRWSFQFNCMLKLDWYLQLNRCSVFNYSMFCNWFTKWNEFRGSRSYFMARIIGQSSIWILIPFVVSLICIQSILHFFSVTHVWILFEKFEMCVYLISILRVRWPASVYNTHGCRGVSPTTGNIFIGVSVTGGVYFARKRNNNEKEIQSQAFFFWSGLGLISCSLRFVIWYGSRWAMRHRYPTHHHSAVDLIKRSSFGFNQSVSVRSEKSIVFGKANVLWLKFFRWPLILKKYLKFFCLCSLKYSVRIWIFFKKNSF